MKPHLPRYKYQSALSIPRRSSTTSSHTQHHQTSSRPFWNGTAPSSSKQPNQRLQMGKPPTAGCGGCSGEVAGEGGKRGYGVAWIADGNVWRNNRGEGEQDFLLPRRIVTCPMWGEQKPDRCHDGTEYCTRGRDQKQARGRASPYLRYPFGLSTCRPLYFLYEPNVSMSTPPCQENRL